MLEMSDFFLVAGHVLLCLEIHAEKGITAVDMILAEILSALASALCKESRVSRHVLPVFILIFSLCVTDMCYLFSF